jgi:hypothetical protein
MVQMKIGDKIVCKKQGENHRQKFIKSKKK